MTNEEILQAILQVDGLKGMTINELLFASGLINLFDEPSINKIIR